MAGDTTFTFLDSTGTTKSARAGSDGSSNLAPAATLYDENAAVLKGQKARAASLPTVFSTEDAALLDDLLTNTTFNAKDFATQTTLAAVLAKLSADPATQTTLAAILAKLIAAPATEAKQDTGNTSLASIITLLATQAGYLDGVETLLGRLPAGGAATEAKQDTQITAEQAIQATAGATTGAAVVSDANGTIQQYLRGIVKIFADIWDSVNHAFGVKQIGTWTVQPGNTANTTPWLVSLQPTTSGGASIYRSLSVVATGASVKASAGQLYGYYVANLNASSTRYLKIYDKASAPTVGTDTPVITIPIPPGSAANVAFPNGVAFALGIGVGATTLIADADATAPSANEVVVNLFYK
jgi:hypothetical protein